MKCYNITTGNRQFIYFSNTPSSRFSVWIWLDKK